MRSQHGPVRHTRAFLWAPACVVNAVAATFYALEQRLRRLRLSA
ncbi:hypothetical protein [Comamonas sp. GB3 AK4-5]